MIVGYLFIWDEFGYRSVFVVCFDVWIVWFFVVVVVVYEFSFFESDVVVV